MRVWNLEYKCNKGIPKTPNYSWFLSQSKSQDGKAYQPYCITEKWKNSDLLKQLPQPKYQASPEWNIMTNNTIFSSTIKRIKNKFILEFVDVYENSDKNSSNKSFIVIIKNYFTSTFFKHSHAPNTISPQYFTNKREKMSHKLHLSRPHHTYQNPTKFETIYCPNNSILAWIINDKMYHSS